jgi:hypothetical protein
MRTDGYNTNAIELPVYRREVSGNPYQHSKMNGE